MEDRNLADILNEHFPEYSDRSQTFIVCRTSSGDVDQDPPCPNAILHSQIPVYVDENHIVHYNYLYSIKLNSLDDLLCLCNKIKEDIIIHGYGTKEPKLEIYDTRRE